MKNNEITIIYPPTVDWYLLYQRPQQLLTAFSKHKNVRSIFVTSQIYKRLPYPIMKVNNDLFIVRNGVDYTHLIKGKKVLWFSYPQHHNYARNLNFDFKVFDAIDNPADEFSEWRNKLELAIKDSDIIMSTAKVMYDEHSRSNKHVYMLPNGADFHHFSKAKEKLKKPADFPNAEGKVIGFYGAMASWVDFDLIDKIADYYNVVLIGNNKFYSKQTNHPNIYSLPHKDYRELPNYLSHFDATMIPFKLTEMIRGCDPIKFYEFLSAGKIVFATEMEELVNNYSNVTTFINHDNYKEKIEEAFANNSFQLRNNRMKVAKRNSWKTRADDALKIINSYL